MKTTLSWLIGLTLVAFLPFPASAEKTDPEKDLAAFRDYFAKRFPQVQFNDYVDGAYALDENAKEQWLMIEEFPPYEIDVEEGQVLFETPFKNGKGYASCFKKGGIGIKQDYPYFDAETGEVKTLEQEINECRVKNGEKPLKTKKGEIAQISAYMTSTSRGNKINVVIPDDPRALAAYEEGKHLYYAKRGQLNFSCADCHVYNADNQLRSEKLSPSLGHITHFPVYRSKWGELGTIHRRFAGCNKQVRAKPFKAHGQEYRNLEYFLTYMSNGLPINGPATRK